MLSRKLQEIKNRIENKSLVLRTDEEKELLEELNSLGAYLVRKNISREFRESVKSDTQITSGPGGSCPCCGK